MYFAYGWPKVAFTDLEPGDSYIYLHASEKFFFAVSRTCVQLWTGGMHRLKLSECVRSEEDVKQEGWHVAALWSPVKATLAVLTSNNHLHLYAIHAWKDTLLPSANSALRDIHKTDIYLRSSIRMDSESRALSITGDSRLLLVGFADGTIASLSWQGKMREVAYPLDDADDYADLPAEQYQRSPSVVPGSGLSTPFPELSSHPAQPGSPTSISRNGTLTPAEAAGPNGALPAVSSFAPLDAFATPSRIAAEAMALQQPSSAIMQMCYCESSKQLVMVLADGSCAVCSTSDSGLSPLSLVCFGRWLCGPESRAVCAQVGAQSQLIAVGRENGEVDLYRMHRTAVGSPSMHGPWDASFASAGGAAPLAASASDPEPPVRTLSLESWGHRLQQTGQVAQLEWSPDCRALAVGYAGQGVVVWSPSGCRLMCSLRQAPPSAMSPFPSTMPRGDSMLPSAGSGAAPGFAPGQGAGAGAGPMGYQRADSSAGGPMFPAGAVQRLLSSALSAPGGSRAQVPLDGGVSALCWGPMGYQLAVAEIGGGGGLGGGGGGLVEVLFAHSLAHHHRVAYGGMGSGLGAEELHVLQGHDRLLLIREAGEGALGVAPWAAGDVSEPAMGQVSDLTVVHVPLPYNYVASNWPVQRVCISASGGDIAVSGRNGLAVYSRAAERWRLFGDVSQERQVSCRALGWLGGGVLVACSGPDPNSSAAPAPGGLGGGGGGGGSGGHELLLLPRYHLDLTSLLARYPLQQPPIAMDCSSQHILLAYEPLEISLLEVAITGELSPTGHPRASISAVRQISMYDVGRPLSDVALVPLLPVAAGAASGPGSAAAAGSSPRQCVLLRWGGLLSVLDLEKGSEVALATEIESFWLSDAITCDAGPGDAAPGLGDRSARFSAAPGAARPAAQAAQVTASESTEPASAFAAVDALGPPAAAADAALHHPQLAAVAGASGTATPGSPSRGPRSGGSHVLEAAAAAAAAAMKMDVEMPWWLYGPAGMQLCFPSSLVAPMSPPYVSSKGGHDIELEFDQEVYPVGISLADDAIIGITQRIVRGAASLAAAGAGLMPSASQLPCFHPIPESQPVLPCLLRRLLQRGAFQEAVSLARRHARGPHFARSLEWLLFTALELETNTSSLQRGPGPGAQGGRKPSSAAVSRSGVPPEGSEGRAAGKPQSLLSAAADLVHHFPTLFAEVVVSVARKTDAALWPPLFEAVGSASSLLEGLVEAGELASAACFLLIIDRLEGAAVAQAQALRLMRASLRRGQYPLCCELLRFVVPPSEHEGLSSELSFSKLTEGKELLTPNAHAQPDGSGDQAQRQAGSQSQQQRPQAGSDQGGRSWLGWLLGYGAAAGTSDQQQQQQPPRPAPASRGAAAGSGPTAPAPDGASQVQQTLALLGEHPSARPAHTTAADSAFASVGFSALHPPPAATPDSPSAAPAAKSACRIVAEHAWALLESGQLPALGQLAAASSFLPGGLSGLMDTYRDTPYAASGCASHTAPELIAALAQALEQLPVWTGEEVERCAASVAELSRSVGAVAWAVALAVLLVDAGTVSAFRGQQPEVWADFLRMLLADEAFSYLWDIAEVMSGQERASQHQGEGAGCVVAPDSPTVGAFGREKGHRSAEVALAEGPREMGEGVEVLKYAVSEVEAGPDAGPGQAGSMSEISIASPRG